MMLDELKDLLLDKGEGIDDFQVILATTSVDGEPVEEGVIVRNIGDLEIGDIGPELYLYPSDFVDECKKYYRIKNFLNYEVDKPEEYELVAVDRIKKLPAGRRALLTVPIIGALWHDEDKELWLLQSPKEQWPDEWFTA